MGFVDVSPFEKGGIFQVPFEFSGVHVSFRECKPCFFHNFHSAGKIVSLPIRMSDRLNPLKFGLFLMKPFGGCTLED